MEVILLQKIGGLGNLGDKVSVKPGHANNLLFPQGKAVSATKENLQRFEARRAELEKAEQETLATAKKRGETLQNCELTLAVRASEEGKLYGSLGMSDLIDAINKKTGSKVQKSELRLPNGAIRQVGTHEVQIQLHPDVIITVKINVEAEKAEKA